MTQAAPADAVIESFIELAKEFQVEGVVLFGSRARGDAGVRSDYDFALRGPQLTGAERARFELARADKKPTLLATDVVWLDENLSQELRDVVKAQGIILYDTAEDRTSS